MLRLENISKNYGTYSAISSISLELEGNQVVGLLGPNGAGKSTSMKIMSGAVLPTDGKIFLSGTEIHKDSDTAWRKDVGFLPEKPPIYEDLSVFDNLWFWGSLVHSSKKALRSQIDDLASKVGLTDVLKRRAEVLSKGFRQRLGIAVALLGKPKILILDEPVSGLDPKQMIEIRDLIKNLGKDHLVIFSSHQLSEVEQVCSRFVFLNKGKLVTELAKEDLGRLERLCKLTICFSGDSDFPQASFFEVLEKKQNQVLIQMDKSSKNMTQLMELMLKTALVPMELNWEVNNLEAMFLNVIESPKAKEAQ